MSDQAGRLADRVDVLERRIAALEAASPLAAILAAATLPAATAPATLPAASPPTAVAGDAAEDPVDAFWALHGLRSRVGARSVVLFTGTVTRPGGARYEWQQGADVDDLLAAESWDTLTGALSALAHPARLNVLREVLSGRNTASALAAEGPGTSGQLYHHLRQLTSAGWLRAAGRGRYEIPAVRVIPLLTILAAASR